MAASLVALALLGTAAHAGTSGLYVSGGIGTSASTGGAISDFGSDGQMSGRLEMGKTFGIVSFAGGLNYYGVTYGGDWSAVSTVAVAKLDLPIVPLVNGYVRLGLEHTWLSPPSGSSVKGLDGNGWTGGLGVEYKLDTYLAGASVWLDYTRHADTFKRGNTTATGDANMLTLGASFNL
ncbi:MAG TPA: outer membrane beta-barrel protein [Kofleriaceae bacterium]|nr:outer membrane beta-barrel protein [Kofleriaceae bacterium]